MRLWTIFCLGRLRRFSMLLLAHTITRNVNFFKAANFWKTTIVSSIKILKPDRTSFEKELYWSLLYHLKFPYINEGYVKCIKHCHWRNSMKLGMHTCVKIWANPLFLYFLSSTNSNTNWKKGRWCAWDSNSGLQMVRTVDSTELWLDCLNTNTYFALNCNVLALFTFYALPSVGKSKDAVVH